MSYAQNKEDLYIAAYLGEFKGTLLEIGANDGITLSNSRLLIEKGWKAHLVEPSKVFYDLKNLYANNRDVQCHKIAIGETLDCITFYESGAHVPGGSDRALVSTLDKKETERWPDVTFKEKKVEVVPFNFFWLNIDFCNFDFISIDAEGYDWLILRQIDLRTIGCKCLCIEWNGDQNLKMQIVEYCDSFGLTLTVFNAENLIFIK